MRRGKLVSALGAALLWLTWLCCPATLWADELSITPAFGYAGATVDLSGCGFQAGEGVAVVLDGAAAGQDAADLAGCVRVKRATAPTIAPTVHLWSVSGQRSTATLQAVYAVNPGLAVAVPPSLPAAGGTFVLQGVDFAPGDQVDLIATDGYVVSPGKVLVGPDGAFASGPFTLLPDAPPGPYVVILRGRGSGVATTAQVLVLEPPTLAAGDGGWILDGTGTMEDPRSGARTTVTLQLWLAVAGGRVTGDGQYLGEVTAPGLACGGDPVLISVAGSQVGSRLSLTGGVAAPDAESTIRCSGLPSLSFPLPGGPGRGPPIEIDARDGATADLDTAGAGGPIAHWHYTLRAPGP
jgi:hypothetical protein